MIGQGQSESRLISECSRNDREVAGTLKRTRARPEPGAENGLYAHGIGCGAVLEGTTGLRRSCDTRSFTDQFRPQAPPQHPPDSHDGPDETEDDLSPIETADADMSFLCFSEPHEGQTTSSAISRAL